jgi:hypothetical protein
MYGLPVCDVTSRQSPHALAHLLAAWLTSSASSSLDVTPCGLVET